MFHIDILASQPNGTLYPGSARTLSAASARLRRGVELRLIEETNPDWRDLGDDLNSLLPL